MVFLNPSILFGLFAASIPLIIHLLNLRKLQRIEFSTLAFLKELQQAKIRKVKIKQWLLLLLRTLIIIFLVLAFARPTLKSNSFITGNSTAKSSALFILDNSFSMSYVGTNGSYFNKSKKIIKNIVSSMEEGDNFTLLINSDSVLTSENLKTFQKNIDDLKISEVTESTLKKLYNGIQILSNAKNINKEIFLFSDFQSSTFNLNLKIDSLNNLAKQNGIKLYAFDVSETNINNYSVSELILENSILEINKPITFTAIFKNYSNVKNKSLVASLFLNNKRVAQKSILFNKKEVVEKFTTTITKSDLNEASIKLEEDNIFYDNQYYLSFFVPKKINVLILFEKQDDISFLEAALKSSTISDQITIDKQLVESPSTFNYNNYEVIFSVSNYSDTNLNSYITNGGKIIFIPPTNINTDSLTSLSSTMGLPTIKDIIQTKIEENNYNEIDKINWEHPIFINLFDNSSIKKFESPTITKFIKFNSLKKQTNILTLLDNSSFLSEYNFGKGIVLYFNISTNLAWSNFPIKGIFAPLISRCVYYLASSNNQTNSYITGESIPINTNQLTLPIIDVELPTGKDKVSISNNSSIINYKNTNTSGSYKFKNGNNLVTFANVNFNPKESDLTTIPNDSLEIIYKNLFGKNYITFDLSEDYLEKIQQARYGTELWKHILIFALILALIEMLIARSSKKDLVKLNERI